MMLMETIIFYWIFFVIAGSLSLCAYLSFFQYSAVLYTLTYTYDSYAWNEAMQQVRDRTNSCFEYFVDYVISDFHLD